MRKEITRNPVPWNPANAPMAHAQDCVEQMHMLAKMILDGKDDIDLATQVRGVLSQWETQGRNA